MPGVRTDLEALVRIPSVSLPSADRSHVERSAEAVAELLRGVGVVAEVVRVGGGLPAVIGRRPGQLGAPRVLLYAHHDVQPAGDPGQWASPPFEPTERDGRLFARGAADDKAGVLVHVAALRALGDDLTADVRVIVEGEEEVGSASLPALLASHRDTLKCDAIVLADSSNWSVGTPSLTTTLRGLVRVVVTVRALDHGVHSGMFGGAVPDALTALCRLIATCHEEDGSVAIRGLRHDPPAELDYPQEQFRLDSGLRAGGELIGRGPITSRLWTSPAVTLIGVDAPGVEDAANVLLPTARAKLSVRLAPTQDWRSALDALRDHLMSHAPWGVQVEIEVDDVGDGFVAATTGPYVEVARASLADAWGVDSVDIGIGGTIPFVAEFRAQFPDAAILVTGVEDPDTRAHGADESLHLAEFERACLAEALLLDRIGQLGRAATEPAS